MLPPPTSISPNLELSTSCFPGSTWEAVKNLPANAGDKRDLGSIPGSGRSLGERNGHPPPYSCLENPMDRGVWQATVHRVTQSQTQLKPLSTHTHVPYLGKSYSVPPSSQAGNLPWPLAFLNSHIWHLGNLSHFETLQLAKAYFFPNFPYLEDSVLNFLTMLLSLFYKFTESSPTGNTQAR